MYRDEEFPGSMEGLSRGCRKKGTLLGRCTKYTKTASYFYMRSVGRVGIERLGE